MTTIRDIARISGYSVSTVSRVLNHKNYVSDAVRAAIQRVIDEQDYVPNDVARDLSRGLTKTIGIVLPHLAHPFFAALSQGIMAAAFANDYNVTLLQSKYAIEAEHAFLAQLRRKAFDGLIFTSHSMPLADMVPYQKYGPVVVCHDPGNIPLAAAYTERLPAYVQALAWIKRRHYQRVAITVPRDPKKSFTAAVMVQAYRQVFGHDPAPRLCFTGTMTNNDGYAAGEYFLSQNLQPDFIFTNGDDIAAGIWQYYREHQQPAPALMGQGNQLSGRIMRIPTIDHHIDEVGTAALRLAIGQAKGQIAIRSDFMPRTQEGPSF